MSLFYACEILVYLDRQYLLTSISFQEFQTLGHLLG